MTAQPILKIADGAAWRKEAEEGSPLYLPTEHKWIRVRPPDFGLLAETGNLPDILSPIVNSSLGSIADSRKLAEGIVKEQTAQKSLFEVLKMEREVLIAFNRIVWVMPEIVDQPTEGHQIAPKHVRTETLQYVMGIFSQPADVLDAFLEEQKATLESLVSGGDRAPVAEPLRGDQPVVGTADGSEG